MSPLRRLAASALLAGIALATAACGLNPRVHRIAGSASSTATHNVLFVGAGFRDKDQVEAFRQASQALADGLLADPRLPYSAFGEHLSFWRIDVRSRAGVGTSMCAASAGSPCGHQELVPPSSSSPRQPLETVNPDGDEVVRRDLRVEMCYTDRKVTGSCLLAWPTPRGQDLAARLAARKPGFDTVVVLANTRLSAGATRRGGPSAAQSLIVVGVPLDAAGLPDGLNLLAHELGHALGLADEYVSGTGTLPGDSEGYPNVWRPDDPCFVPATGKDQPPDAKDAVLKVPWLDDLGCGAIPPASAEPDQGLNCDYDPGADTNYGCPRVWWPTRDLADCPLMPHGVEAGCLDHVGLYEGALYVPHGVYRPAWNCKMRDTSADFCPVCDRVIRDFFRCQYATPGGC